MTGLLALVTFSPFQPTPGLALWSLIIFLLFWFIVGKMAFKPIANAIEKRENEIQDSMDAAKIAKQEMINLQSENDKLLAQAREERSKILQEAKDSKNNIIAEAKEKAKEEASKVMTSARRDIETQKQNAMKEVKNEVGTLALGIAEKVIKKELKGSTEHEQYVNTLVNDLNLN